MILNTISLPHKAGPINVEIQVYDKSTSGILKYDVNGFTIVIRIRFKQLHLRWLAWFQKKMMVKAICPPHTHIEAPKTQHTKLVLKACIKCGCLCTYVNKWFSLEPMYIVKLVYCVWSCYYTWKLESFWRWSGLKMCFVGHMTSQMRDRSWIILFGSLLSKGTFDLDFNFLLFWFLNRTFGLVLRLDLWISKTFRFNYFHKEFKADLIWN
jgi:hypothetical protein